MAAAASLGEAAATQTQAALAARLLDNALRPRLGLDALGGLTEAQLDEVAREKLLFRVTVLSPTGERELSAG